MTLRRRDARQVMEITTLHGVIIGVRNLDVER